ncbi:DUF2897 family protein [Vibrio taketomensis]|uniref:DUF2897 family protein n=1 Tax=Vibrio taketomensis TaxID=2572923 RepID=UPI001389F10B|nr:DUF2897 family protein [Vibrio taketomensis]
MDLLTNPWVIIAIVLAVIIGNISALKYTANMKFDQMKKKPSRDEQISDQEAKQEQQESEPQDPPK